jgi:hypothetical protein
MNGRTILAAIPIPVLLSGCAYWVLGLLGSWLATAELSALLVSGVRHYPDANQALFASGGILLLDVLQAASEHWPAALGKSLTLFVLALLAAQVPLCALVCALAFREDSPLSWLRRTSALLARFVALGFVNLGSLVLVGVLAGLLALAAALATRTLTHELLRDATPLGLLTLGILLLGLLQPAHDIGRIVLALRPGPSVACWWWGVRSLCTHPSPLLPFWCLTVFAGWAPAALLLIVSDNVGGPAQLGVAMFSQQASLVALVVARVLWLRKATHWVRSELGFPEASRYLAPNLTA